MNQELLKDFMRTMSLTADERSLETWANTIAISDNSSQWLNFCSWATRIVSVQVDKTVKEIMVLHEQEQAGNLSGPGAYRLQTLLSKLSIRFIAEDYPIPIRTHAPAPLAPFSSTGITIPQLRLMFPHFCNLQQLKTCAEPSVSRIYLIVQNPEFGGIILQGNPTEWLQSESHCKIVLLHIYCLCRIEPSRSHDMHINDYKVRNEKSLLHNSQRLRILENCGIVTSEGELTPKMNEALEGILYWVDSNAATARRTTE